MSYIITGLAASGKSTLAKDLVAKLRPFPTLIVGDNYRFIDVKWTKAPRDVYVARISAAALEASTYVFDSFYRDGYEAETASVSAMGALVEAAAADAKPTIINIQPVTLQDTMKNVIRRTVGRAKGDVPQGPCPETFDSATELVVSVSKNYACEAEALHHFVVWAKRQGCNVISVPYEDARAALGL